jgi:peptidoglycan/LPS O-acetylase OafA/YrhL
MFHSKKIEAAAETKYYPWFDYLRAVAALGVFIGHADRNHILPANLGNASVQLFFALSGFLIGGILLRSHQNDLPRFYFNRAVRIWVPYAIAILILAVVTALKQGFSDPKFLEFFFYMVTFVYNWFGPPQLAEFRNRMPLDGTANHFWSICVEEQFYLVAPFLILFLPRPVLFAGLAGAVLLSPDYFASISLGVMLAVAGPQIWIIATFAALGVCLALTGPYIAAAAFVSTAIVGALARLPGRQSLLGKIAGGASYPFYLNHWLGLFAINAALRIGMPYWMAWSTGLTIAIVFSVIHYLAIDRTIAAHRGGWFSRRSGILLCGFAFALVVIGLAGGAML